jgi:hypothetical protein
MRFDVCALTISALLAAAPTVVQASETTISIESPMTPPPWALLERELLRANAAACQEFFAKYFDERGYLLCVERWGATFGRAMRKTGRGFPAAAGSDFSKARTPAFQSALCARTSRRSAEELPECGKIQPRRTLASPTTR